MVAVVRAITGWPVSLYDLMNVGERRLNLQRLFNAREGFSRQEDCLPVKFFKPLLGSSPNSGLPSIWMNLPPPSIYTTRSRAGLRMAFPLPPSWQTWD